MNGATGKPNIVYILADDLGLGDVQCLNPKRGKIATPNLDRLAAQGMVFTDAHATSSVCTPSRYSILTGRYNWRSPLQRGIVSADDGPLIPRERLTVAKLLQQQGYATGCVGKWHLGWEWGRDADGLDYAKPFTHGPTDRGFDWYFGVMGPGAPPHGYIENDRLLGEPSLTSPEHMLRWGGRAGPMVPGFTFESMLPTHTDKACEFVEKHAAANKPFFLYYALNAPHSPIIPNKQWIGSSGLGQYADFVQEMDFEIGRLLDTIDQAGVGDNTLVIFTSDNGCSPMVGTGSDLDPDFDTPKPNIPSQDALFNKPLIKRQTTGRVLELEAAGHFPSANMRGYKSDAWDGGHRVPYIVRWPGNVQPGTQCDQLISLMDLMATCADLHDLTLPEDAGEDSVSLLPLMQGDNTAVRNSLVHHSFRGKFAIRQGKWKLMLCPGSGGWWKPSDEEAKAQGLPHVQLYDMGQDIGERHNLQAKHPDIVQRLIHLLEEQVADGRTTPGPRQSNDATVDLWKLDIPNKSTKM
jgi:arylsulfatase A